MRAEEPNPYRRQLTLSDWHFAYCLPVSERQFERSAANRAYGLYNEWDQYAVSLARAKAVLSPLSAAGLHVAWGPPAWVFPTLLRQQSAVVLLTHAVKASEPSQGVLEFCGDMVPFTRIADGVNTRFAGILDVCACECQGIRPLIKRRAPGCAVKIAETQLSLNLWLAYYDTFLRLFLGGPITYYDAIVRARELALSFPELAAAGA
jgi:hypothetical protein